MILTVRRMVEQWMMWIAVDAIEVFMWWKVWAESGNSVALLLMWLLFLVNGIYLRRMWLKDMAVQ
jgi:nicotinamide mononucleotide transporter